MGKLFLYIALVVATVIIIPPALMPLINSSSTILVYGAVLALVADVFLFFYGAGKIAKTAAELADKSLERRLDKIDAELKKEE